MQTPIQTQITSHMEDLIAKSKSILETCAAFDSNHIFYNSVDVRMSNNKVSGVDTNAFPAGFINVGHEGLLSSSREARKFIEARYGKVEKIAIIAESHTRNEPYIQGLDVLLGIITDAGFEARLAVLDDVARDNPKIENAIISNGILSLGRSGFVPELIILNNDITKEGVSELSLVKQPINPPLEYGWNVRLKSRHFEIYNRVVEQIAAKNDFDPWLMSAYFDRVEGFDVSHVPSLERCASIVETVLNSVKRKYKEYGITRPPSVFLKSNRGTYGMGIIQVFDPSELFTLNKNNRKKMLKIKHGIRNDDIIVQEGVNSIFTCEGSPAEPVVYMVNKHPVDIFYRSHDSKSDEQNLNSTGAKLSRTADIIPASEGRYNLVKASAIIGAIACGMEYE